MVGNLSNRLNSWFQPKMWVSLFFLTTSAWAADIVLPVKFNVNNQSETAELSLSRTSPGETVVVFASGARRRLKLSDSQWEDLVRTADWRNGPAAVPLKAPSRASGLEMKMGSYTVRISPLPSPSVPFSPEHPRLTLPIEIVHAGATEPGELILPTDRFQAATLVLSGNTRRLSLPMAPRDWETLDPLTRKNSLPTIERYFLNGVLDEIILDAASAGANGYELIGARGELRARGHRLQGSLGTLKPPISASAPGEFSVAAWNGSQHMPVTVTGIETKGRTRMAKVEPVGALAASFASQDLPVGDLVYLEAREMRAASDILEAKAIVSSAAVEHTLTAAQETRLRELFRRGDGRVADQVFVALTRSDWEEIRRSLAATLLTERPDYFGHFLNELLGKQGKEEPFSSGTEVVWSAVKAALERYPELRSSWIAMIKNRLGTELNGAKLATAFRLRLNPEPPPSNPQLPALQLMLGLVTALGSSTNSNAVAKMEKSQNEVFAHKTRRDQAAALVEGVTMLADLQDESVQELMKHQEVYRAVIEWYYDDSLVGRRYLGRAAEQSYKHHVLSKLFPLIPPLPRDDAAIQVAALEERRAISHPPFREMVQLLTRSDLASIASECRERLERIATQPDSPKVDLLR